MGSFRVMHFAVDGELLESSTLHVDALSKTVARILRRPLMRRTGRRHPLGRSVGFLERGVRSGKVQLQRWRPCCLCLRDSSLIFPDGHDIAFIDEVYGRHADDATLNSALEALWGRRVPKAQAMGIHGLLFYELEEKKPFYPNRRDEDAENPGGYRLR